MKLFLSNLISKDIPNSSGKKGSTSCSKGLSKGKKKEVLVEKSGLEDQQICKSSFSDSIINSMPTSTGAPSVHQHGEVSSPLYPWQSFYSFAMTPFHRPAAQYHMNHHINCSLSSAYSHWYHPSAATVLTLTDYFYFCTSQLNSCLVLPQ